jgi:glutathione S-transferase
MVFVTRDSGRRTGGLAASPVPSDPDRIAEGERYMRELASVLNTHLRGREWLVGEKPSLADFALGAWIPSAGPAHFPLDGFVEIARWYRGVEALPGWLSALASQPHRS